VANVAGAFLEIIAEEQAETPLARRRRLFREAPHRKLLRWSLGTAYALHPKRVSTLPFLIWHTVADLARGGTAVPGPATTRPQPDAFAGVASDVTPERIIAAARRGYFAWCHVGPLKWWTRSQRMVIAPADFHITKDARQLMRRGTYRVTFDLAFNDVIAACAEPRPGRPKLTWITPQIMHLYAALHEKGAAHSFEVWNGKGELVGGGYGLAVGRVFVTESMFSRESSSSKVGFASLNWHLARWGFVLNDAKDWAAPLENAGMKLMPRAEFEQILAAHASGAHPAPWSVDADTATIAG
jgi:leucyl/phenylalanyl-tRNA--protein transferase